MNYTICWSRCWSIVGTFGVGLSILVWDPTTLVVLWLTATFCAGLFLVVLNSSLGFLAPPTTAQDWWTLSGRSALAGAGVVAVCALAEISGALAGALVLIAAASSPWVVARVCDQVRQPSSPKGPAAPADDPTSIEVPAEPHTGVTHRIVSAGELHELSNQELCHQWRRTYIRLQYATTLHELMRVVTLRQSYLDELDRRSPTALRAWLQSGARAAGGPDRYLKNHPGHGHSHAA